MSPKRNDPVAPPTVGDEWYIRYNTTDAIKGWDELEKRATTSLRSAYEMMRNNPGPSANMPPHLHYQLKGDLSTGKYGGRALPLWQIKINKGDRVWYLLDEEEHTVRIQYAGPHPKETE